MSSPQRTNEPGTGTVLLLLGAMAAMAVVIGLVIAMESPAEEAWNAFAGAVRDSGETPYPLKTPQKADSAQAIRVVAGAKEIDLFGERGRSDTAGSRACMWGLVTGPDGTELRLNVYLEAEPGGWKVRDLSLRRACDHQKSPRWFDLR